MPNEALQARARLRSWKKPDPIHEGPKEMQVETKLTHGDSQGVLDELGGLLNTAIARNQHSDGKLSSILSSEGGNSQQAQITPSILCPERHKSPWRDSPPKQRAKSTLRPRSTTRTTGEDSLQPRSSPDSMRVGYAESSAGTLPEVVPSTSTNRIKQQAAAWEQRLKTEQSQNEASPHEHDMEQYNKMSGPHSLVDARTHYPARQPTIRGSTVTALRHKLEEVRPDIYTDDQSHVPNHAHKPLQEARTIHTPPIPLALPQLVSPRRSERQSRSSYSDSSAFENAPTRPDSPINEAPTEGRAISIGRLFHWNLFNQKAVDPKRSSVSASAGTYRGKHDVDTGVEQHIKHLMQKSFPGIYDSDSSHKNTDAATENEKISDVSVLSNGRLIKLPTPPASHSAIVFPSPTRPRSPRKSPSKTSPSKTPSSATSMTPVAPSSPRTPQRGRPNQPRRDSYMVEQRYSLSRSRSRGGVRISVEVESPAASPRMDDVLIVRANVGPLEEEKEE